MPIVLDKGGGSTIDRPLKTFNRKLAGSPQNVTTPAYAGEIILDTLDGALWKAEAVTSDSWVPYQAETHG